MNSYPDPTQTTGESLPFGEPEYREYPPAPLQPRRPSNQPMPAFPAGYPPPVHPAQPAQPVPGARIPHSYSHAGQAFQPMNPQPPLPMTKKGSRGWIVVLSVIGAAILILVVVLIYTFSMVSSPHIIDKATIGSTSGTGGISKPGVVNLGQSITIDGLTATALSVNPLKGDGTTNPIVGNKFVVVNVRLQNGQSTSQFYSPADFHVFNGDNRERDVEVIVPDTYTANQQLSEGFVDANGNVEGDLIIQVPVDDHNVKLAWSPGTVTPDFAYEWNLGL